MKSRESPDVQAAILAVHLGLVDEAEKILAGIYLYMYKSYREENA
jgi:hypothetical protein